MTRAVLLGWLAGVCAAVGTVELVVALPRHGGATGERSAWWRALLRLLARLGRRAGAPAAPGDLRVRIAAAGAPFGLRPGDVMAVKGGAVVLAFGVALLLGALLPGRLALLAPVALPAAAFLAPDLWLRRRARARGRVVERELPDLLDLLRVALAAGLPLERAIGDVGRRASGLLAREWRAVAAEVQLGVPRERALAGFGERCACDGVAALVRTLDRAARHGAPLGEALLAQAAEARAANARRLNEAAARAAPKIQLVVALLLVPSVLLLVAAALLTAFAGG
ncbi:type II secretion system F family protein [Conexibacter sp. JD483]|uniref:type II secretion system F family protein n=1 Tax=unclassified Conexibacter TaxID=2627773 RepID=UPI002723221C|nr:MULTISPECIES: type II secretion system F family protein [unclassified Conexibacter]MDO8184630.1 type II secretion system F family protein [Conexibacter sp. CPCC 205706]MDO8197936.1 type II secretion system F family protein [Conexibacter sp. CPCC 205762]MDR9372874.1 type II secretion system F family protein [Conexibacter sp. JD483]